MNIFIEILGYLAAICIPLAFLPQTIKLIKTRNTSGLSIFSYSIYQLGGLTFLIFGILRNDIPMITCQTITATLNFIIIGIIVNNLIKQKNKEEKNV
ncbi:MULTISPECIES: SemiSWEET family sugar transporter [unclassified Spiroplasma]|uniref:SemiSWEET family sugar transporter n=1 Tax=unclassified Spiroplasma TaxID=2637901 RepID=UPI00157AA3C8|nr:SemiSWEET family transporter [Spiroplasma endosymbiont of Danaus chrysippus]MBP1525465.1 glutathione synthetase [Spiroplasma ixodetis]MBP1526921.1 glutathione synthetase [Spiroplasma ixodetis]MBP1528139.1 glutathione synthetase [Spiroplasma ixodetis]